MVEHVSPKQAWEALSSDPAARLVDVRTDREWQAVGIPDLAAAGKETVLLSWQLAPRGDLNPAFLDELRAAGIAPEHKVYFICRSGMRSEAAAEAARRAGYTDVFNVAQGFEGGRFAPGWKGVGLPWRAP